LPLGAVRAQTFAGDLDVDGDNDVDPADYQRLAGELASPCR
jgi:hypothetical protein